MIIGLIAVGWLVLALLTWSLCVVAARGDAALTRQQRGGPDRTARAV